MNTSVATRPIAMSPMRSCLSSDSERSKYSTIPTMACATNQMPALIPSGLRNLARVWIGLPRAHLKRSRFDGSITKTRRTAPITAVLPVALPVPASDWPVNMAA
ncbi:hypothetical protein BH24ACT19_BH24ACT19_03430 [soil metagenome]